MGALIKGAEEMEAVADSPSSLSMGMRAMGSWARTAERSRSGPRHVNWPFCRTLRTLTPES